MFHELSLLLQPEKETRKN